MKLTALKPGTQVRRVSSGQIVEIAGDAQGNLVFFPYNGKNRIGVTWISTDGAVFLSFLDFREIEQ